MTVDEFKKYILKESLDNILTDLILTDGAVHVSVANQGYIKRKLSETYKVDSKDIQLIIVGSAKLGFSISEKKIGNGITLPRYRPFRAESDIDIAIISPLIFEAIWNELSRFSFNRLWLPWDSDKLGDYMVCGWLRPDYFPRHGRLRKCDDWWDTFRNLSAERKFGRRMVRGGLFYNFEQLKMYHSRSLNDCIEYEKIKDENSTK